MTEAEALEVVLTMARNSTMAQYERGGPMMSRATEYQCEAFDAVRNLKKKLEQRQDGAKT